MYLCLPYTIISSQLSCFGYVICGLLSILWHNLQVQSPHSCELAASSVPHSPHPLLHSQYKCVSNKLYIAIVVLFRHETRSWTQTQTQTRTGIRCAGLGEAALATTLSTGAALFKSSLHPAPSWSIILLLNCCIVCSLHKIDFHSLHFIPDSSVDDLLACLPVCLVWSETR